MVNEYTITLTDVEQRALEYVAYDANDWIQNAVHERCRLAIEEMVGLEINNRLNAGLAVSGTKEEIVMSSTLPTAKQRHEDTMSKMMTGISSPTP
jgi:hypothetical protein